MASMTYCMFENTSLEMKQVVDSMEESSSWEELDLNEYEESARQRLYNLCKRYVRNFDRLSDDDFDFNDEE
jgi:hypothetical protein